MTMGKIRAFLSGLKYITLFPVIKLEEILPNYNPNLLTSEQDCMAIRQDWDFVGRDLEHAMNKLNEEINKK